MTRRLCMKKQYIIIDNKKNKYVKKCICDVLDIKDSRGSIENYSVMKNRNILPTHEISIAFLEQLTEQVSTEIFKILNKKKDKCSYLCLRDRYIVEIDNVKYLWVTLFWNDIIGEADLWIKFWHENAAENMTDVSDLVFNISNREETKMCDKIRFGQEFKFWADQINVSFSLFSKSHKKGTSKKQPVNYPDVTLNCFFDKKVNSDLKQQLYNCLSNYIFSSGCNIQNDFKIHDFFLIDSNSGKKITVFIDFGNCGPEVLEGLLQYLSKSELGITRFSFE